MEKNREREFVVKLKYLEQLDETFTTLSQKFELGSAQIAYAQFNNESLVHALKPTSYAVTPATLVTETDNEGRLILSVRKPQQMKFSLQTSTAIDETDLEEQKRIEKYIQQKDSINVIKNFPVFDVPPALESAQQHFSQALSSIIAKCNIIRELRKECAKNAK